MNIYFSPQHRIYSPNLSSSYNANSPKNSFHNTGKINGRNNINKACGRNFKQNNILENLMKQKENLMDNKNKIMKKSLEKGEDPRAIKEKLESIDKQIEEIDKQVHELQLEEQRKAIGTDDKNKNGKNSKEESNKDYPNDMKTDPSMDDLLNLSTDFKKAKALSSQRNLMSGDARVLHFEIQTDTKKGINPINKKKYLAKLENNIEKITEELGNHLKDINNKSINNIQSTSSNNIVDKNEQRKNSPISENSKAGDRMVIIQEKAAQNIKHYKDNMKDTTNDHGENINIIA